MHDGGFHINAAGIGDEPCTAAKTNADFPQNGARLAMMQRASALHSMPDFMETRMHYQLTPIHCRPWTFCSYLSTKLIESHYENNYGGALRRLNAITEQLESLDFANTPGHVINGLKREELIALNSTLLHELYFASMGGDGQPTRAMTDVADARLRLARSLARRVHRDGLRARRRLRLGAARPTSRATAGSSTSTRAEHIQAIASGIPILALDMYEHAYHMDFGANAKAYVDTFMRNVDWKALEQRYEDARRCCGRGRWSSRSSATFRRSGSRK